MYWRLGIPGWRIAAAFGVPIKIKVIVCKDNEAGVYFATSDDIGLALEAESLDELVKQVHLAIPELLELAHAPVEKSRTDIRLRSDFVAA